MSLSSPSQLTGTPSIEMNGHLMPSGRGSDSHGPAAEGVQDQESTDETYMGGRSMEGEVAQELSPIAILMITLNGTLGTGLYWGASKILSLGGPVAVVAAFSVAGILAWTVMQGVSEMLMIWRIRGAIPRFVAEFVDQDLGIAVGITYWFTYAISYAALISTSTEIVQYWRPDNKPLTAGLMYSIMPFLLISINCLAVKYYGLVEVIFGVLKLIFLSIMTIANLVFAITGDPTNPNNQNWTTENDDDFEKNAVLNNAIAMTSSISIALYAFVGVEIFYVAAAEAKPIKSRNTTQSYGIQAQESRIQIRKRWRLTSVYLSALIGLAYAISGLLVTFSANEDDCRLANVSFDIKTECTTHGGDSRPNGNHSWSAFVLIPNTRLPNTPLADFFNFFLVFTSLSCANTNLYVASRTVWAGARDLGGNFVFRVFAFFGVTNEGDRVAGVPVRAVFLSGLAFYWFPFLQLINWDDDQSSSDNKSVLKFSEVLSNMGTGGVVIVWACASLAYIRFYHCVRNHREKLKHDHDNEELRYLANRYSYPYRSHLQPAMAYFALLGCLFVLIVGNGSSLWDKFYLEPFLSSWLLVILFVTLWIGIKICRSFGTKPRWGFEDLSDYEEVKGLFIKLHSISTG